MSGYKPPEVWEPVEPKGAWGRETLASLTGKPWSEGALPIGKHPLQLYSLGTPNGVKVTILLEELEVEYDAWLIDIQGGAQYSSGFMEVSPNAHIPALVDYTDAAAPVRLFESCSILLYLAEKFGRFIPASPQGRADCLSWLFWQSGTAPYMGTFNIYFFYSEDDDKHKESIDRWALENKRILAVLNERLSSRQFLCGDEPAIADFAVFPWIRAFLRRDKIKTFLSLAEYGAINSWAERMLARPAVARGIRVNAPFEPNGLRERHSKDDFTSSS